MGDTQNSYRGGSDSCKDEHRPTVPNGYGLSEKALPMKSLLGVPWRLAFALQASGWLLRQDIIWHKPNPMPESCRDRCTKAHEYIFLLAKSARYFFDQDAIREPPSGIGGGACFGRQKKPDGWDTGPGSHGTVHRKGREKGQSRTVSKDENDTLRARGANKRSVWTILTQSYKGAHFATFPEALVEPCILAGAPAGGVVLDPFLGSGTTAAVAQRLGRKAIGIELNQQYCELSMSRFQQRRLALTWD